MTKPESAPEPSTAARVVELRRAGLTFDVIADRLNLPHATSARRLFNGFVSPDDVRFDANLEAIRLDRMHTAVWPKAVAGDLEAIDRLIRISERRERLLAVPHTNSHELREAYDASVATSKHVLAVDQGLIESGRKIADRIDRAVSLGDGIESTKAMYLLPHMVNILRELLATPAARIAAGVNDKEPVGGKLAQLRAVANKPA